MVTGLLSQIDLYKSIHPCLEKAIDHILKMDLENLSVGKYEIDGDDIFYMVNEYWTKSVTECEPERHRQYTDIQVMVRGNRKIWICALYKPTTFHGLSIR
jgi:YhcH/YjgK/YiaL family protein